MNRWFLGALLFFLAPPLAHAAPTYSFSGEFSAKEAERTETPNGLASQKFETILTQKAVFNKELSGVFEASAWDEAAYGADPGRYSTDLIRQDSRDLRFRDFYLQFQRGGFNLRLGNQQVVWGEAFGYFYADIVNPRDLREGGFGDFSKVRMQVPMANAKWVSDKFSLQAIYIPQPYFNILPLPSSDYAIPTASILPGSDVRVRREESLSLGGGHQETGARASALMGSIDMSVFYFDHYDRSPYYTVSPSSQLPQHIDLDENHSRVHSIGGTLTAEVSDVVLRGEFVQTNDRTLSAIAGGTLTQVKTTETAYVLGADLPTMASFNIGVQWSRNSFSTDANYLGRHRLQDLLSLHVQRPLFLTHGLEFIYAYQTSDGGQRAQAEYILPLSRQLESRFGADLLLGPTSSDFGQAKSGSRAYILLKCFFKG